MDAATVQRWAVAAAAALDRARAPIDSLNVFPVPDGDTGTNLALTVAEGAEHLAEHLAASVGEAPVDDGPPTAALVAAAFARGALLGARGNSGVIVSQYLHGFARGLAAPAAALTLDGTWVPDAATGPIPVVEAEPPTGRGARAPAAPGARVAHALDAAQRAARAAVARPVEGTILSSAAAAADAARSAARAGAGEPATVAAAVAGARDALARGPESLDVLRAAGVVDAGAAGLVVLLAALAEVLGGPGTTSAEHVDVPVPAGAPRAASGAPPAAAGSPGEPPPGDPGPGDAAHRVDDGEFEVMYVVDRRGTARAGEVRARLLERLAAVGTSVAVVGGSDGWHVHVHTDDPAAAVDAGAVGERGPVVVRRLAADPGAPGPGVVAGTSAPGLVPDLARLATLVLVHAERPVGVRDVRRAVVDAGDRDVVVLPGSAAALAAARVVAAAPPGAGRVVVLDAPDDARVVSALTAGEAAGPDDRARAMRAAVAGVRTAEVGEADPDAVLAAARRLLAGGGEVVTVLAGAGLAAVTTAGRLQRDLTAALGRSHSDVEVVVLPAGQRTPAAVVAVEGA